MPNDLWATPQWLVDKTAAMMGRGFMLDAAALPSNTKATRYISPDTDALRTEWIDFTLPGSLVWLNPPYSDPMPWVQRAIQQTQAWRFETVMLVPDDTSTQWFHELFAYASIIFLRPRVRFIFGDKNASPLRGSMLAILDGHKPRPAQCYSLHDPWPAWTHPTAGRKSSFPEVSSGTSGVCVCGGTQLTLEPLWEEEYD